MPAYIPAYIPAKVWLLHGGPGCGPLDGKLYLCNLPQHGRCKTGGILQHAPRLTTTIQVFRIRGEFLSAILRQDISWYDTNTATDFASRMTE